MKLNVRAFSLSCGLVWGLGVFLLPWWMILLDGPGGPIPFFSRVYRGFDVTPVGSLIGLAWAFPDALVVGALFAWIYNRLASERAS